MFVKEALKGAAKETDKKKIRRGRCYQRLLRNGGYFNKFIVPNQMEAGLMTGIAMEALKASDAIIGYTVYVDLVKDTFPDKEFLTTPMKKEVTAVFLALRRP